MEIKLDKELNALDKFVLHFVTCIKSEYVLVSGYVSILFGRSRMSEDVDILIPRETDFNKMLKNLEKNGFYCLNAEKKETMLSLLNDGHSIRFSEKGKIIPNMEVRFIKDEFDKLAFDNRVIVKIGKHKLFISPIELQIAYKRVVLKSEKDIEDAIYLEDVFKDSINKREIKELEKWIRRKTKKTESGW